MNHKDHSFKAYGSIRTGLNNLPFRLVCAALSCSSASNASKSFSRRFYPLLMFHASLLPLEALQKRQFANLILPLTADDILLIFFHDYCKPLVDLPLGEGDISVRFSGENMNIDKYLKLDPCAVCAHSLGLIRRANQTVRFDIRRWFVCEGWRGCRG